MFDRRVFITKNIYKRSWLKTKQSYWYLKTALIRCVLDDQCSGSGLINVRGADDLVCKDKSLKCCHESNLKVSEGEDNFQYEDEQLCKDFLRAGFRYSLF